VVVDGDDPVGVVADGDQVLLQLADVGAVVDPDRQLAPGRQPPVEQRHRLAVDPVQRPAAGHYRPLGGQGGDGALALVGHEPGLAVAEGAVDLLGGAQVAPDYRGGGGGHLGAGVLVAGLAVGPGRGPPGRPGQHHPGGDGRG
jgi:hypothetical protein